MTKEHTFRSSVNVVAMCIRDRTESTNYTASRRHQREQLNTEVAEAVRKADIPVVSYGMRPVLLFDFCHRDRFCREGRNKVLKAEFWCRFPVIPSRSTDRIRHQKAAGVIQPLTDELRDENLVPLGIGRLRKLGEYAKVWLPSPHGANGPRRFAASNTRATGARTA